MSTTALATIGDKYDQREMIDVIKQTVCKGATDAQLKMFIEVCRSTGLNPFLKEIWYVHEKGIIMAARDGYLRVANDNPQFDGIETRVERDDKKVPVKAVCTVWRKDRGHPVICEAYFSEYCKQSPVWKQYPSAMISKVAEVLALKRSFAINGVVSEEEIGNEAPKADPPPNDYRAQAEAGKAAAQAVAQAKIEGRMPLVAPEPKANAESAELSEFEVILQSLSDPKNVVPVFQSLKSAWLAYFDQQSWASTLASYKIEENAAGNATGTVRNAKAAFGVIWDALVAERARVEAIPSEAA